MNNQLVIPSRNEKQYHIVSRRYNFQRLWEYIADAPASLLYTNRLRSIRRGRKTFMEVRQKEGQIDIRVPTNQENMEAGANAFRLKTRDSKWIPYLGNPYKGRKGLISSGQGSDEEKVG